MVDFTTLIMQRMAALATSYIRDLCILQFDVVHSRIIVGNYSSVHASHENCISNFALSYIQSTK